MKVKITAVGNYKIGTIDNRIYSSFLEHLGRAVYEGVYEPEHPEADENGFREDVIKLVSDLNMPAVRYPGGNFVSAFNWEDSIGPKDDRPTRLDLAWKSKETNEFGLNEFVLWCKKVKTDPIYAINLGTKGVDSARNVIEYCNHPSGSYWSDLRIKHGFKEPHNIKMWCLGNEMDGEWQVGHKTAHEYGRLAHEAAKAMRLFDKNIELVACGSSSDTMSTFPEWEKEVLDQTYDSVDYISMHKYWSNSDIRSDDREIGKHSTTNYLSNSIGLQKYIKDVESTINFIKSKKRSNKDVKISFDEYQPWYHSIEFMNEHLNSDIKDWPKAHPILEDQYNLLDCLLVGTVLNTFINNSHVVKIACMAQLVNVIPAISTVKNGISWRQSVYYPLYFASLYGRGDSLQLKIVSPKYSCDIADDADYIDASAVINIEEKKLSFFIVNRSEKENVELNFDLHNLHIHKIVDQQIINHQNVYISNTKENPNSIIPKKTNIVSLKNDELNADMPVLSYLFVHLELK
tara:strand:- start:64 stop:1611 length:1548 start_codon:yes stop_codon:yes gene_type:complete